MTGFVLVSFSGRVLAVQEVLRTVIEVEQATHLGIIRTTTMKHNIQTNVDGNITKTRRSAYSLFGCGFHGHNGLFYMNLCFYW
jgi:hypothetical protein